MTKIDEILAFLHRAAEEKIPLSPHQWVDAALSLNSLVGDLHDELYILEQNLAQHRADLLSDGNNRSVASVNLIVEATDDFRKRRQLKAKIGQIEEVIRLAKVQAKLKDNEYNNG